MNINLYLNYYTDPSLVRKQEIDLCVRNNLNNPLINVVLFNCQDRVKYSDFFKIINKYTSNDDINIIANLDIYFDDTIALAKGMAVDEALVLGRWDIQKDGSIKAANRPDSQDAWVFKGKIRDKLFGDFNLGYLGCDNRLAHEICVAGYRMSNPAGSIKAIHAHSSGIRNYKIQKNKRKQFEVPGPYRTIFPTEWTKR